MPAVAEDARVPAMRTALQSKYAIVFDSNRSGSWGIWSVGSDGANLRPIFDTPADEVYPDVSANGEFVTFLRRPRGEKGEGEICVVRVDGTNFRVVAHGDFPTFRPDSKNIVYSAGKRRVLQRSLEDGSTKVLFPVVGKVWERSVTKPRLSPDGRFLAFTSDRPNKWNAWFVDLSNGFATRIGRGCQPTWFSDSTQIGWVGTSNAKERSGIFRASRTNEVLTALEDRPAPFGHEYFPMLALNDSLLLYGACPEGEHDHESANYQIFMRDLKSGSTVRVTHDRFTNRWPKLLPQGENERVLHDLID